MHMPFGFVMNRLKYYQRGARWLSGRVSDSGARGRGFETYCISDFAFLPVNCFQSFSCAKKRHESNKSVEIVHYMSCNFSRRITETLTMLVPMLGLDYYFTVHRYDIVRLFFFFFLSFKTMSSQKLDILASCQHQRMTIVISTYTV